MIRFFRIFGRLLSVYLSAALSYKLDFIQSAVSSLSWSGLSFVSAFLLTSQVPGVFGMERADLLLLAGTYGIIVGIHHWLCSRGFNDIPNIIHRGELDTYLLKPFDSLTYLSFRNVAWSAFIRVLGSVVLTGLILRTYEFSVHAESVVLFSILSIAAFFAIYGFYTLTTTILIWHSYLSNIMVLIQNFIGAGRYPVEITDYTPKVVHIYFLPFLLIVNIPTRALVGRLDLGTAAFFIFLSVGFWLLSRAFWRYALHSYTSASG